MKFRAYGHPNITSMHNSTFEFTKDKEVTLTGDCITGVKADFDLERLKKLLDFDKVKITIKAEDATEEIIAKPNKKFDSDHELVVRRSDFASERTFAIRADKASIDFNNIRRKLKTPEQEIVVEIIGI